MGEHAMNTATAAMLRFTMPESFAPHWQTIMDGEYQIPATPRSPDHHDCTVLDLGACVGAFAIWIGLGISPIRITCVEPNPETFAHLRENLARAGLLDRCNLIRAAAVGLVTDQEKTVPYYRGPHNCGEGTIIPALADPDDPEPIDHVPVIDARDLPTADIVKVDIEGSEWPVLQRYLTTRGTAEAPRILLVEYHFGEDRILLERGLLRLGYRVVEINSTRLGQRGILKLFHRSYLDQIAA